MPLVHTQLSTAPHEQYNQAGEESTHDTTYTGVDLAPWSSLPLISAAEKEKVQGSPALVPQEDLFDMSLGMPLYWQERKTVHCWKSLLKDFGVKAIFDLTLGSGACGRAAMDMGSRILVWCAVQSTALGCRTSGIARPSAAFARKEGSCTSRTCRGASRSTLRRRSSNSTRWTAQRRRFSGGVLA